MASSSLQWELLKTNSSFTVKRNGHTFSTDPYNLTNEHTPSSMGLVNKNGVGLSMSGSLEKKSNLRHFTVLVRKNKRVASAIKRKNGKSNAETPLIHSEYNIKKGINRTAKFLQSQLKGSRLLTPALRRLKALHESTKIKRKTIKKSKRNVA
mmetsp:Transcript_26007/g.29762  ORF Transcript_26007/g.29762 Transcript_26007/m.29762 type:complete len:152 (+) Transcript_26007:67-522(+)